jgi:hypothetical protein
MNKNNTISYILISFLSLSFIFSLTSSTQRTKEHINFQDYCWPILGESDTILIYQYEMTSVQYDTVWNRYFKIEAHSEDETRYFDYTVYTQGFDPESHYKHVLDHKGIRLTAIEVSSNEDHLTPGTIEHQRIFDWDLKKGDQHTSIMKFNNHLGDNSGITISSTTKYEGPCKKSSYKKTKLPTIQFSRMVTKSNKDTTNTSEGISYYAKGIGYYRSHINYNNQIEFDEVLTKILTIDEWNTLSSTVPLD